MVSLPRLREIFSIDLNIEINNVNFINREGDEKIITENKRLHVNVAELSDEERRELIDVKDAHFEDEGRVFREEEEEETAALETSWEDEMAEILDFFDGLIYPRYVNILEKSLYLRSLTEKQELTKGEIDAKKGDMVDRLGGEANYVANLCAAGYFDENRTFREIWQQMYFDDEYEIHQFKDVFHELVTKKLICVFVEREQSVYEVTQEVRASLAKYQREEPPNDYIDVRGIGDECRETIDGVMDNLENEFMSIDYSPWQDRNQMVIRIHPASLPPLGESHS